MTVQHVIRDSGNRSIVGYVIKCPAGDAPCWHGHEAAGPDRLGVGEMVLRSDTLKGAAQMLRDRNA